MPATYAFYPKHNLVVLSFSGAYTSEAALGIVERYTKDPKFRPTFELIIDLSDAEDSEVAYKEMQMVVDKVSPKLQQMDRNLCVIIATTDLFYGVARMYQTLINDQLPYPIEVVRSARKALARFDIDGDSLSVLGTPA
jgi:hypothetical protein